MSIRDLERIEKLAIEKAKLAIVDTHAYQSLQKRIEKNLGLIEKKNVETTEKITSLLSGGVVASKSNMSKIQTTQNAAIAAIQKLQADVKHDQGEQKRYVDKAVDTAVQALIKEKGAAYVLALDLIAQDEGFPTSQDHDDVHDQAETTEGHNVWGGE